MDEDLRTALLDLVNVVDKMDRRITGLEKDVWSLQDTVNKLEGYVYNLERAVDRLS